MKLVLSSSHENGTFFNLHFQVYVAILSFNTASDWVNVLLSEFHSYSLWKIFDLDNITRHRIKFLPKKEIGIIAQFSNGMSVTLKH